MSKRLCNVAGLVLAWAAVGSVFQYLLGIAVWQSVFSPLLFMFALMAIFEGTLSSRLGGKFVSSRILASLVDFIPPLVVYTLTLLIARNVFELMLSNDIGFLPLVGALVSATLVAPICAFYLNKVLAGPSAKR